MNITSNTLDYCFLNDTLKCPSLTHDTNLSKLTLKKKSLFETDLQLSVPTVS